MGGFSLWHWLVVGIVVLLLFGKGRFSDMMGDVAKGLKSFKKGISEEDEVQPQPQPAAPPRRLEATPPADPAPASPPAPAVDSADRAAERREP